MKKIITVVILTLTSFNLFSQTDTTTVEQYCEVVATPRAFSTKVTIDINYGEERSLWRDNRLKTDEGKLKKFNSVIDALNYMGKDGWVFVNAYPGTTPSEKVYHYIFKKTFSISQIME